MKVVNKKSDISDHETITSVYYTTSSEEGRKVKIRKTFCDVEHLYQSINSNDFFDTYLTYDVNEKCETLLSVLKSKVEKCSIKKFVNKSGITDRTSINAKIRELSAIKKKLFIRHRAEPNNESHKYEYLEFKKQFKKHIRNTKINHKRQKLQKCNGNSKRIWKIINEERGKSTHSQEIPTLLIEDSRMNNEKRSCRSL